MKSALKCLQYWDTVISLALLSYKIKIKMFQFVSGYPARVLLIALIMTCIGVLHYWPFAQGFFCFVLLLYNILNTLIIL